MPPRDRQPRFFIDRSLGRDWAILMKDKRIRYRSAEIEAVVQHEAKCFVVTRGDLNSADMARRFIANKQATFRTAGLPGPYIYSVQHDRLDRLFPKEPITRPES